MEKQELMYEGKAKRVYKTDNAGVLWIEYKDSATAFNGEKKSEIAGKGQLNNEITSLIFARLKEFGIESHFIKQISGYEQLVQQVSIIPLEVVTRNIVAGSLANRLGLEEGTQLKQPIVEFYYKNDELGDPLITEDHIEVLEIASLQELALLKQQALKINDILSKIFLELGVRLVDFKLEFGKDTRGAILLADEISPDTCRLWDKKTNQKLDKDVFRRDLGDITIVYQEILNRLKGETTHV
ncbi:phosphoribosylaminoimidazolesuccinocarboxamide synthase [Heyndrickxia oleronia]|uniref:Phosphoribosylaminoimidazole-succinocarboxamide synthase n=1 Tax=Heyndrickxia oleronia TaxID=38875 RepID=A0AAW6SYQ4_9BACI|nr:phosphoribosylaminoimidazolesuccinocarboxamide synthase [Heyndrickxia oleronia]MDH5163265.1 phosphoribosylaminoimidazolesuccinocarboxamide synthase [Heyndrickxia oleronia]